jgi:hypothetical protein
MDELVLCTIQKKKHSQEVGQRKKSTKRKTKEQGLEQEAVPAAAAAGDVEQGTKMAATLGGGSIVEHHMLQQNEIGNVMPAAEAHTFSGFFPSLSNSNYGHLSTTMDHSGPSSVSFPSQQSHGAGSRTGVQGPLLNNQVSLNHQDSDAASTVEYDQRNGVGFTQDHLR